MIKMCNAKTHRFFTAFVILAFIISCSYSFISYHAQLSKIDENKELIDDDFRNVRWHLVVSSIESIQRTQKIQSKLIAMQLKEDIANAYPNLNELQAIFDSGSHSASTPFSKIVLNTVQNSRVYFEPSARNGVLIGINNTVLYNLIVPTDRFETPWNDFIRGNYNRALATNLNAEIISNRKDLILLEPGTPKRHNSDHVPQLVTNIDDLKKIFRTEGYDGLENYLIVTPAFITDDGDIFGTLDYDQKGHRSKNHKIIVMTYVSLMDFIHSFHHRRIAYIEHMEAHNKHSRENDIRNICYQSIQTVLLHLILIICIFVFSKHLFHGDICVGEDQEGEDV